MIKNILKVFKYLLNPPTRNKDDKYHLSFSVFDNRRREDAILMITITNSQYVVLNIVPVNARKEAVPVNGTKPVWKTLRPEPRLKLNPNESGLSCTIESTSQTGITTVVVETTIWLKNGEERKIKGSLDIEIVQGEASSLLVGSETPQEIEHLIETDLM